MFNVHKRYIIRQAILNHLKSKIDKKTGEEKDLNLSHTSLHDLAQRLKISFREVLEYHHALHQLNHINSTIHGGKYYIVLEKNGYAAAIDEFWLREGEKELNEKIYDKAKWFVPLVAVIITAASLIFSVYTVQRTRNQVEVIKSDLEKLKLRQNTITGIYHK